MTPVAAVAITVRREPRLRTDEEEKHCDYYGLRVFF
jgi:hypothetical protein